MRSLGSDIDGERQRTRSTPLRNQFSASLDALEAYARGETGRVPRGVPILQGISLGETRRAARCAEALLERGGSGISYLLEGVLNVVALSTEPEFVPFWERMMAPRHRFQRRDLTAPKRAELGALALGRIAKIGEREAMEALLRVVTALAPTDRGIVLLQVVADIGSQRPAALQPFLALAMKMATNDDSFEARYLARCALILVGKKIPMDRPNGVYAFNVRCGKFSFTAELLSKNTLSDLHVQIQCALGWDDDHSWCFWLGKRRYDRRFEWPAEEARVTAPALFGGRNHSGDANETYGPVPVRIGELGLRQKNKLIYHFDFGDNHLMPVVVSRIEDAHQETVKYPRIVVSRGTPPEQYAW
jgi:hypothetical protein